MRIYFSYFLHEKYHSITVKKKCDYVTLHGFFTWGFWHFTTNVISKWNIVWKDNMIHKHFLCSSYAFLMQNFKLHLYVNLAKIATSSQSIFARHLQFCSALEVIPLNFLKNVDLDASGSSNLFDDEAAETKFQIKRFNRRFPVTT